jgi:subtilisin family serine protease
MRQGLLRAAVVAAGCVAMSATAFAKFNLEHEHVPGELIVMFKDHVSKAAAANKFAAMGAKIKHQFRSSGAMQIQFAVKGTTSDLHARAEALAADPEVQFVEANQILRIAATMPDDTEFGQLYGMHNNGGTGGTPDADIDAPEAWDISTGSRDVLVGVIDTGVAYTHPDIAPNYWTNPGESGLDANGADKTANGIDDDGNGFIDDFRGWDFVNNDNDPMDDHDHGTHCAGTIGGAGNNGMGVAGVNWTVSMVGIKFLSGSGSGTLVDAVKAIEYGTLINATMTSNSWGGGGFSDTMDLAIRAADDAGVLFIAAAGNSASNNDSSPHYPSSYAADNVIAVAATDHSDGIANFSSYGATSVDVGAPGVDILSSVKNGTYTKFSGTSMATPHVAGIAALVKAVFPDATHHQIKARILNTADPVASLAGRTLTGGRANAFNALEIDNVAPDTISRLTATAISPTTVGLWFEQAHDDADNFGNGSAARYEFRYAATPIMSEDDWSAAQRINGAMGFSGGGVTAELSGLPFNFEGYVAVKAVDNVGNVGPLSETVGANVVRVVQVMQNRGDSLDGVTVDAPWGVEMDATRSSSVFSDSPAGNYADNIAGIHATFGDVNLAVANPTLVINTGYDLESGYDFGYVEISTDAGVTWLQVDRYTGVVAWSQKSYDLAPLLNGATSFRLRFRMTTDSSIVRDGWKIDDVAVFAPVE